MTVKKFKGKIIAFVTSEQMSVKENLKVIKYAPNIAAALLKETKNDCQTVEQNS